MAKREFKHPHERTRHVRRKLTAGLIVVTAVIVVATWGLLTAQYVVKSDISKRNVQTKTGLEIVKSLDTAKTHSLSSITQITSNLGFNFFYDPAAFETYGQTTNLSSTEKYITGESFADDEVKTPRDYSIVRLRIKEGDEKSYGNPPQLSMSTNIRKDFWVSQQAKAGNEGKSKIDMLVSFLTKSSTNDEEATTSDVSDVSIGTITYKKIVISVSNEKYGVKTPTKTFIYATVQNDRPYWSTISFTSEVSPEIAQFESVIGSLSYNTPTSDTLSYKPKNQSLTGGLTTTALTSFTLPKGSSYVPDKLSDDTLVKVVARNQPSVVRVLLVYCTDMHLDNGTDQLDFKDLCTWGVGSGSIISSDGYIVTNGHVINTDINNLMGWGVFKSTASTLATLKFMVSGGLMSQANADAIIAGWYAGDQYAISALNHITKDIPESMISLKNSNPRYMIQLGNDPVRIDKTKATRWQPMYNETNIEAKYIDEDYDAKTSIGALSSNGQARGSDVALLKANGTFPVVKLGSIDSLTPGDQLTAIGYPYFLDKGPDTTQKNTVPSVTQGTITDQISDGTDKNRQLLTTTVPVAQGNSGGPSFNSDGEQIGLNTYSYFSCADFSKCFGNGVVRDIADTKALIEKNKVVIGDFSTYTKDWYSALDYYSEGNFKKAIASFEKIKVEYPANYMVEPLLSSANEQLGTETDLSASFETVNTLNIAALAVVSVGSGVVITTVIFIVIYVRKYKREVTAHTGQPTTI